MDDLRYLEFPGLRQLEEQACDHRTRCEVVPALRASGFDGLNEVVKLVRILLTPDVVAHRRSQVGHVSDIPAGMEIGLCARLLAEIETAFLAVGDNLPRFAPDLKAN
jgi:hypothetical protein